MKSCILFLSLFFAAQAVFAQENQTHIVKLEIPKKKKHTFRFTNKKDSSLNLLIDTLIMNDKSDLQFSDVKKASLTVKHALIGKQSIISGTDGQNNGTKMNLKIRFDALESLFVVSRGADYQTRPKFGNGDGGDVQLEYDSTGKVPQFDNRKQAAYISIMNPGGGKSVTPQNDLYVIRSRIAMGRGVIGRPLTNLPQGRVYDGTPGTDGKKRIDKY